VIWERVVGSVINPSGPTASRSRARTLSRNSSRETGHTSLVPGAKQKDLAVIRWAQPYYFPERKRRRHLLPLIVEKNNLDKHKNLQEVLLAYKGYVADEIDSFNCVVRGVRSGRTGLIEVGTELARVYVRQVDRRGPTPDINARAHLITTLSLNDQLDIEPFFAGTRDWLAEVLRRFSAVPPSLADRLGLT
jgi:hypothetical protein